jgi:hypothetical protein
LEFLVSGVKIGLFNKFSKYVKIIWKILAVIWKVDDVDGAFQKIALFLEVNFLMRYIFVVRQLKEL